jgi:hypothetical protein
MPRLYTYCIPCDDGAAPNPFWGVCTLAICKPAIRRTAQVGDWIVGTGSRRSRLGDISRNAVYIMKVTKKLTMAEYDDWAKKHCARKIPEWGSKNIRRRVGDSIYDFDFRPPQQREGVHGKGNIPIDLGGKYVLLSKHFYYFGNSPIEIPDFLEPIIHRTQGHRVRLNQKYLPVFIKWIKSLRLKPNKLYGQPVYEAFLEGVKGKSGAMRNKCAKADSICRSC